MPLPIFRLEDYMAQWEFKAPYLLCCSDAETLSMQEVLALADGETQSLWNNLRLSYTEVAGLPLLRQEIAKLYPGCTAENVFCFAGAEEGILCTMQALFSTGDHGIVVTPCYQSLLEAPRYAGAEITTLELDPKQGWELDLNKVESAIRSNTRIIVVNYPHNPTGARLGKEKLKQLIGIARKHGVTLFCDEVYRLLGPEQDEWEEPVASLYESGISLGVMSKAFGLAGLRIGWIATQNITLIKNIERIKYYASICNSAPSELLALIALRAKDQILQRNNEIVRYNIALLDEFFSRHSRIFNWVRPKGGCIGFVQYNGHGVDDFCERLVTETGVFLLPGHVYEWPGNYFRIGFGRSNLPQALARLEKFIELGVANSR